MQKFMEAFVMGAAVAAGLLALVMALYGVVAYIATFFEDYEDHCLATSNRLAEIDRLRQNEVRRYGKPNHEFYPAVPYSHTDVAVWYIQSNRKGWAQDPIHRTLSGDDLRELGW